jgi:riboflavin kinase / FMN adenylyltransferase
MSAMKILTGIEGLRRLPAGCVLSVGNFDGIHLGHRRIIETARGMVGANGEVALVTFEPHPLTVLRPGNVPPRLTPLELKNELLAAAGVAYLVELPPTPEVLNTTAEEFWAIIRDGVRPAHMVEGTNFNFGKGRGGTIGKLQEWAAQSPVKLHVIDGVDAVLCDLTVVPVSSSLIRWLLAHGRCRDAARCLGRAYVLEGTVVEGFKRGRTIGVPTANLRLTANQLLPPDAVYAGRCNIDATPYPAAVSIGKMPTFGDQLPHQLEVHIIGFTGDLYGRVIRVELVDYLREQWKFGGVEPLKYQIGRDIEASKRSMRSTARVQ